MHGLLHFALYFHRLLRQGAHVLAMQEGEFLPAIITQFSDEERTKMYTQLRKHIVNGKFVGRYVQGRPTMRMTTRNKTKGDRRVAVHAAHVVLLMNGYMPKDDEHASHLCHNSACIFVDHLVWESAGHNMRRSRCKQAGVCVCKLAPACLLKCVP
jgi:hypothetical protein